MKFVHSLRFFEGIPSPREKIYYGRSKLTFPRSERRKYRFHSHHSRLRVGSLERSLTRRRPVLRRLSSDGLGGLGQPLLSSGATNGTTGAGLDVLVEAALAREAGIVVVDLAGRVGGTDADQAGALLLTAVLAVVALLDARLALAGVAKAGVDVAGGRAA